VREIGTSQDDCDWRISVYVQLTRQDVGLTRLRSMDDRKANIKKHKKKERGVTLINVATHP